MERLDFEGKPLTSLIIQLAWPALLENMLHTMVFFVDMLMVARLGTVAIASVGLGGAMIFVVTSIFQALSAGATATVARFVGARNYEKAGRSAINAIALSVAAGLFVALFMYFFTPIFFGFFGVSPLVKKLGTVYVRTVLFFAPFRFFLFVAGASMRGAGDTRTPMKITFVMNSFNILMNYLLIFGPGPFPRLEVFGAGIATGSSFVLGMLVYTVLLWKMILGGPWKEGVLRFDRELLSQIVKISTPTALEQLILRLGFVVFLRIVTSLGTIALAAHEIAVRIESMSFMLGIGFGTAAATLVGQGLGAELQDIAEKSVWRTAFFSMVVMTVIGMLFVLFPEALVSLFSPSVAVGEMAVLCIMVAAFEQPSIALTMTLTGGMRGAGDTVSPLILSFLGTFAFRIPLVYLFAIVFRLGIFGVWLGTITDWGLRGIISVVLFRRGRWKKIKIR